MAKKKNCREKWGNNLIHDYCAHGILSFHLLQLCVGVQLCVCCSFFLNLVCSFSLKRHCFYNNCVINSLLLLLVVFKCEKRHCSWLLLTNSRFGALCWRKKIGWNSCSSKVVMKWNYRLKYFINRFWSRKRNRGSNRQCISNGISNKSEMWITRCIWAMKPKKKEKNRIGIRNDGTPEVFWGRGGMKHVAHATQNVIYKLVLWFL